MFGLSLLKSVEPTESGRIVTACPRGSTGGRLWQLELQGSRRNQTKVESSSEEVVGEELWKSYEIADLSVGIYKVESAHTGIVFVQVTTDQDLDVIRNEAAAWRLLGR